MADVEEPQFNTLKERIAALNRQKNFKAPPPSAGRRAPPPPPSRAATETLVHQISQDAAQEKPPTPSMPPRPTRAATEKLPPLPRRNTEQPPTPGRNLAPPPPLPSRNSQQQVSPALPSRRPSGQVDRGRRNSNASDVSYLSTISNLSLNADGQPARRLPPTLDQAKLPPLPPTKREREAKAREDAEPHAASDSPSLPSRPRIAEPPTPSLPPRLPSRPGKSPGSVPVDQPSPSLPPRRLPPLASDFRSKSALEGGFGGGRPSGRAPPIPVNSRPPPVPLTSRPTSDQIDAVAARPAPPVGNSCLTCRDFSGPDNVAAQHPLHSLPRQDPVGYLAHVLCDPFLSHTDKARAIFTWEHHNIAYDVYGFFNGCIPRGQSPGEMIFSGKAVCEGYARIFHSVAERAGLQSLVVDGHGKGFGYDAPEPGRPCPPKDATGHAWNAVRIDGGEWKLLDPCWGAGHLGENQSYKQQFDPSEFTMPNEVFGMKHFPSDLRHFFRADGRVPSWEEYILGPTGEVPPVFYGTAGQEGLNMASAEPRTKNIRVDSGGNVRFQISKICEHWTAEKNGKGKQMLFLLAIKGPDGGRDDFRALETDGYWFWVDVPARELGMRGQSISLYGLDTQNGKDARGVTKEVWDRTRGKYASSFVGIGNWDLV